MALLDLQVGRPVTRRGLSLSATGDGRAAVGQSWRSWVVQAAGTNARHELVSA